MKPGPPPEPRRFFSETIPLQFNATLDAQERLGESGRELYQAMREVDATLCVEVSGEGGGRFYLNIRDGRMSAGDAPTLCGSRPAPHARRPGAPAGPAPPRAAARGDPPR